MKKRIIEGAGQLPVTILLLEDDDGDAKALIRNFKKENIANPIIRVLDGVEALEHLRGEGGHNKIEEPYVIIADINMPRMDGLTFLENLRKDPNLSDAVVFMLTTSKNEQDITASYMQRVAGYVHKGDAIENFSDLLLMIQRYWPIIELPDNDT